MSILFEPITLGNIKLKNRIVMAPMTRGRAPGNVANDMMAQYYARRADAGLIITEGVSPSPNGLGYPRIPGLYNKDQLSGWKKVTEAVHQSDGKIFVQLMHTGRVSHPANLPPGARVLAPSALAAPGEVWTDKEGSAPFPVPEEMNSSDIKKTIDEFADACSLAIEAGFDGVELHGANGYLIDQFLNVASNHRTDEWGCGSIENRLRFCLEVVRNCIKTAGADRLGIRLSPYGVFNGMTPDSQMDDLYERLAHELNALGVVYIHVVDHSAMGTPPVSPVVKGKIRDAFHGRYILSGGYDVQKATVDIADLKGDLVAFGRPFIANPDLVEKMRTGKPLKQPDPTTFYTPGEKGYMDY